MTRRQIVTSVGIGTAAAALGGIDGALAQSSAPAAASVKALLFDTFGTVVDWRGSIIEEGKAWEKTPPQQNLWDDSGSGSRPNV
jgi:2-haloacid dehalogenase